MFTVRLLGQVEITDGEKSLTQDDFRSVQMINLFSYLMSRDNLGASLSELAEILWPEENSENPAGALKNLMYRLRKLMASKWPDKDLFVTGRRSYHWNTAYEVSVDILEIRARRIGSEEATSEEEKIRMLSEGVDRYNGRFLTDYASGYWAVAFQEYLHRNYLISVRKLCKLLDKKGDYREMERVCLHATSIDPLDDTLQCWMIRAYLGRNDYVKAGKHYQQTVQLQREKMGTEPSEELQNLYEIVLRQSHAVEERLEVICSELEEEDDAEGAFFCEYGVFKKIYELEIRREERMHWIVHLLLITVEVKDRESSEDSDIVLQGLAMEQMKRVLRECLHKGDLFTRYSQTQILVMLPGCDHKQAKKIIKRINDQYCDNHKNVFAEISYGLREIISK